MSGNSINEILTKLKEPPEKRHEQSKHAPLRDRVALIWLPVLLMVVMGAATFYQIEKLNRQTAVLGQQTMALEQQIAVLDQQNALLKQQTASIDQQTAVLDQQRTELDELRTQLDFTVSSEQLKIRRTETIKKFFDEFAEKSPLGKKLAIESVRTLLSADDAARLIGLLAKDAGDGTTKTFAREALRNIRQKTISGLYSDRPQDRTAAYTTLIARWGKDPALVQHLFAEYDRLSSDEGQEITKSGLENGLYNTLALLNNIDLAVLRDKSSMIEAFAKRLTEVDGKTEERKKKLLDRLDRVK